jgi:hypothetical protein
MCGDTHKYYDFFLMTDEEHDFFYQLLQNFRFFSLARCIYHFLSFPMCFYEILQHLIFKKNTFKVFNNYLMPNLTHGYGSYLAEYHNDGPKAKNFMKIN